MAAELKSIRAVLDEEQLKQRCMISLICSQLTIVSFGGIKRFLSSTSNQTQLIIKSGKRGNLQIKNITLLVSALML